MIELLPFSLFVVGHVLSIVKKNKVNESNSTDNIPWLLAKQLIEIILDKSEERELEEWKKKSTNNNMLFNELTDIKKVRKHLKIFNDLAKSNSVANERIVNKLFKAK